ncbi:MAG: helix-turn-helix domain-containing protein, partial [Planctomycetes bacterium]|nr:helix-turn-helix domain-containing protein [Planctomycetota bacterium]
EHISHLFSHKQEVSSEGTRASGKAIEDVEKELIYSTLEKTGGNKTKAAELLKITTRTLRNKLNKYNTACSSSFERETISCAG